ncbi:MAG: DapH/DapD/GlmU-related protein [Actinomycetota bacterium]
MTKRSFFADVRADLLRWQDQSQILDPSEFSRGDALRSLFRFRASRMMVLLRLGQAAHRRGVKGVPSFVQKRIMKRYGCELMVSGHEIGPGLYIPHPVGVVVSPYGVGPNCSIIHAVTIGMGSDGHFPTIGEEVFIGAGARVIGDVKLGDGCKVGANAVVVKDVPPGASVGGVPAREIGS